MGTKRTRDDMSGERQPPRVGATAETPSGGDSLGASSGIGAARVRGAEGLSTAAVAAEEEQDDNQMPPGHGADSLPGLAAGGERTEAVPPPTPRSGAGLVEQDLLSRFTGDGWRWVQNMSAPTSPPSLTLSLRVESGEGTQARTVPGANQTPRSDPIDQDLLPRRAGDGWPFAGPDKADAPRRPSSPPPTAPRQAASAATAAYESPASRPQPRPNLLPAPALERPQMSPFPNLQRRDGCNSCDRILQVSPLARDSFWTCIEEKTAEGRRAEAERAALAKLNKDILATACEISGRLESRLEEAAAEALRMESKCAALTTQNEQLCRALWSLLHALPGPGVQGKPRPRPAAAPPRAPAASSSSSKGIGLPPPRPTVGMVRHHRLKQRAVVAAATPAASLTRVDGAAGLRCRACRVRPATVVLAPREHLCLCRRCSDARRGDASMACSVCRAAGRTGVGAPR